MGVPKHIAIILDGNRRFAKRLMIKPWMGHEWGEQKVEKLLDWCQELGVKELTLYAFSMQNFNRPKKEFDYIMNVFNKAFASLMNEKKEQIMQQGIRFTFIGRTNLFPTDVQENMHQLSELTKNNKNSQVNIAMAYGGREEVIDAVKKVAEQVKNGTLNTDEINEEVFGKNLYTESEPDLIIRTGGDKRTSNFLIWQSNYSEWVFLEKTWPEFEKQDLITAINDFNARERRFGK
ncbi:MAG: polyprenyl diphosphate synthase [Candidatus Woesearchaeota archaeon]|nr:polyprenyl diphosphate synthase [Candidatus Woesearchaeota archaeon]